MTTTTATAATFKPEVWVTSKPLPRSRRRGSFRKVTTSVDHARAYAKKVQRDAKRNEVTSIAVWLSPTTVSIWTPEVGWAKPIESTKRADWLRRTAVR